MENETFTTLEAFQDEIARLKSEEAAKERGQNATLLAINERELTEDDRAVYEKLLNGELELESFNVYRKNISQEQSGRHFFAGFIANQLQFRKMQEELRERAVDHERLVSQVQKDPELKRLAQDEQLSTQRAGEHLIKILGPKPR